MMNIFSRLGELAEMQKLIALTTSVDQFGRWYINSNLRKKRNIKRARGLLK